MDWIRDWSPDSKASVKKYIEGYWRGIGEDAKYPMPQATDKEVDPKFLERLTVLSKTKAKREFYFGGSPCRLCKESTGCEELTLRHGDVEFVYPGGLKHYYVVHKVQPSAEFVKFIMSIPV